MENELDQLIIELKSDKAKIRSKAFAKFYQLLNSKIDILQQLLENPEEPYGAFSWRSFFISVHEGIIQQANSLSKINKETNEFNKDIKQYSETLQCVIKGPSKVSFIIPYKDIVKSTIYVLQDEPCIKYFGSLYLTIIRQALSNPENNFTEISTLEWKDLLERFFKLMKSSRHTLKFVDLSFCTYDIIDFGTKNSHLQAELNDINVLKSLTSLMEKRSNDNEQNELIAIAYQCCKNMIVENQKEVYIFLEGIMKYLLLFFEKHDLNERLKVIRIRFLEIILITYCPYAERSEYEKSLFTTNPQKWQRLMNSFELLFKKEIGMRQAKYRYKQSREVNHVLIQCAARFTYYYYWRDVIDKNSGDDDDDDQPSTSKRVKLICKMEALLELVNPPNEEFNWKWFNVLVELIANYPKALIIDDIPKILKLLAEHQSIIEQSYQIYAFTKCCFILLQRDKEISNLIVKKYCNEFWTQIADGTLSFCSRNSQIANDFHGLLQFLIRYEKCASPSFIESVIKAYTNNNVNRNDLTLKTLIIILKTFNLESLPNGKELTSKILNFGFQKITTADLKKLMASDKSSNSVLSELAACSCIIKTDVINFIKKYHTWNDEKIFEEIWDLKEQKEYKNEIQGIIKLLDKKLLKSFVLEDDDFLESEKMCSTSSTTLPIELECLHDQPIFEELMKLTDFRMKVISEENSLEEIRDYLSEILENIQLMMHLASTFIDYSTFNEEKLNSSFIAKRIDIHIQGIERLFTLILRKGGNFDMIDTFNIITSLHSTFAIDFHPAIAQRIRRAELKVCLNWIVKQLENSFDYDEEEKVLDRFSYEDFLKASKSDKIRYYAITTLCQYHYYGNGLNDKEVIDVLMKVEFYMNSNIDIHALLDVIEMFGKQQANVSSNIVEWIWKNINSTCYYHSNNLYIIKRLIESLDCIVRFSKPFNDVTCDLNSMLKAYSNMCSNQRRKYSIEVALIFLKNFHHYHRIYFKLCIDEENVQDIYQNIVYNFLESRVFAVQIATIKCFSSIMQFDIDLDMNIADMKTTSSCRNELYKIFKIENSKKCELKEKSNCYVSFSLQLSIALFCVNFHLRKPMIFDLSKLFYREELSESLALECFGKILKFLNCDAQSLMDSNSILHLMSKWIINDFPIHKFPWYFSGLSSYEEFVTENYKLLILTILKNKCDFIQEFVQNMAESQSSYTIKDAIMEVISDCFAYSTPVHAKCDVKEEYKEKVRELQIKINDEFTHNEQQSILMESLPEVLIKILGNIIDKEKFQEISGLCFEYHKNIESITTTEFENCIKYIKNKYVNGAGDLNLITYLCTSKTKYVEQIFMQQRSRIQATKLKEHKLMYLMQYCILVEFTIEYMIDVRTSTNGNIKEYLILEVVSYLGFLIKNHECGIKLRETAANFLFAFLKKILPNCAEEFKKQMNRIVSDLLAIVNYSSDTTKRLREKCFKILDFIIFEQSLSDVIATLDRFPSNEKFGTYYTYQHDIKYKNGDFNLEKEINNFLSVKNRSTEGLRELSSHLSTKKKELVALFQNIPRDENQSILHDLIRSLIDYVQKSTDESCATEAIKCLGEIGCHNLFKITFYADDKSIYENVENIQGCQKLIAYKVLDEMENLLLDADHRVIEAASRACHHIFSKISSDGYPENALLRPFRKSEKTGHREQHLFYLEPKIDKELKFYGILEKYKAVSFSLWLRKICVSIMVFAGDKIINSIIYYKPSFAEVISSLIYQLPLYYDFEEVNNEILKAINYFFNECNIALNYKESTNNGSIFIDKKAIREMLKYAEVLRVYCRKHPRSRMANMMNLNYLHIARAAQYCEAHFTAIMYCEMWALHELENDATKTSSDLVKNKTLQNIMYQSYMEIGVRDALDVYLDPFNNRGNYLQNNNLQWLNMTESLISEDHQRLTNVFRDEGMYELLHKFNTNSNYKDYECLWRLSKWDDVVDTETEIRDQNGLIDYQEEYNKYHYLSLQNLKKGDELGTKYSVEKSRRMILNLLSQKSLECTNSLYKYMEMSHRLVQIDDFSIVRFKRVHNSHENLLEKWAIHNEIPFNYKLFERILTQRSVIFDTANIRTGRRTWIPDALKTNMIFSIKEAIASDFRNDASNKISMFKNLEGITNGHLMEVLIEDAKLHMKSNLNYAKDCLMKVINEKQAESDLILKSTAYHLYGEILAQSYSFNITEINEKYFEKSLAYLKKYAECHNKKYLLPNIDNDEEISRFSQNLLNNENESVIDAKIKSCAKIFDDIAKYFDREYIRKSTYMKSAEFISKKELLEKSNKNLEKMNRDIRAQNEDIRKSYIILMKSTKLESQAIQEIENEKRIAAKTAIYNYVRSIIQNSSNDIFNIFRVISLMLENFNSITFYKKFLNANLSNIPSYKFIVALPQLTVRLTNNNRDDLTVFLKNLLERCAIDHPHHTLPALLALVNSNADMDKNSKLMGDEPRTLGAKSLWENLKKNKEIYPIMISLEKMSLALIDLAYLNVNSIPSSHNLLKIRHDKNLQCPTVDLPIHKNAKYPPETLTYVMIWDAELSNVGGINAPKKLEVLCSDGFLRSQLLKGKDDMRQDAIMQQIFGVVNQLLMINKDMKNKQARIRTYKVVPFSRRSGILEWCSNTIPIGTYLRKAHEKYRPNDWKPEKAIKEISLVNTSDNDTKLRKFQEICQNLKPVFHQFFYEHYKSPGMIFERRFAYTVSVALSSIIGFILGIGDRHVMNILIDLMTAEVVHIDFGIAFEGGKYLPHPELIPFRLTRDIIAPMGVSGVNGVFRKTCEKTLEILREHKETIVTILEVLLHDPMYSWSVGTKHARSRQLGSDSTDSQDDEDEKKQDVMATRALQRVIAKLNGFTEDSNYCYSTIEGQIESLIQSATNDSHLSKLFRGWQAFL